MNTNTNTVESLERELAELHIKYGRETIGRQCAQAEQAGNLDRIHDLEQVIAARDMQVAKLQAENVRLQNARAAYSARYSVSDADYDRLTKENMNRRDAFLELVDRVNSALDTIRERVVDERTASGARWLNDKQVQQVTLVCEIRSALVKAVDELEID